MAELSARSRGYGNDHRLKFKHARFSGLADAHALAIVFCCCIGLGVLWPLSVLTSP
jgi:hypothetical protein